MKFKVEYTSKETRARTGILETDNLYIQTPVFMPVGTQGSVKAVNNQFLERVGFDIILGNTYHLYLRPGTEVISQFSGLHDFVRWNKAILTDSGGYQIFSLQDLRKITNEGVTFKSHIDGSEHFFSPEKVIEIQRILGSNIMMVLDECTPYPCEEHIAKRSMELSIDWASRSKEAFNNSNSCYGKEQLLFGIGQGSMYKNLRREYLEKLIDIGFDGYAIGGLSVGEPSELMYKITDHCTTIIPKSKPRYLMGVGTPENILNAIALGVDMFDCVLPTRNARNGQLFTKRGKINIKNAKYKYDKNPIDESLDNFSSREYSLSYIRHLFMSGEILGLQIATEHNLAFYNWLLSEARRKIQSGEFISWKDDLIRNFVSYSE